MLFRMAMKVADTRPGLWTADVDSNYYAAWNERRRCKWIAGRSLEINDGTAMACS